MTDNQQNQHQQQPQQQQPSAQQQQQPQQQQQQRQMATNQQQASQQQPGQQQQSQQQQQQQNIQPQQAQQQQPQQIQQQQTQQIQQQPQQIQQQQPQQIQQQQTQQLQQQQQIQQLPQLQQIAPQQPQHVMQNLQAHTMTSVPLSMAMGTNPMTGSINMVAGSLRPQQLNQLPQVQVIHQAMHSPPYLPQFYNHQQQQLMLQNMQAAMQANVMNMNPQQISMANMVAMQGRPNMFTPMSQTPTTPTTPNIIISSGANTQITTSTTGTTIAKSGVNNKQSGTIQQQQQQQQQSQQQQTQQQQIHTLGQVQQAQATAMVGGKPIILGQAPGSTLLQGQIGVISTGQLPTTQAYTTGQFGQMQMDYCASNVSYPPQTKQGQQLGVTNASGQGQAQIISSQNPIRFSQPQLIATNAGSAQLITSQPVFTNQMLQAMQQLQQYPQQSVMSAQCQSPTIIAGQGLYIRPANQVQAQGIMTGVQTSMNAAFKNPTQQTVQTVTLPIQKQTTAAQTGKVLLPSVNKTVTAKVPPSNASGVTKTSAQSMSKPKGRPKGSGKASPATTATAQPVPKTEVSSSKPSTPTNQLSALPSHDKKSQSDSEIEVAKKNLTNKDGSSESPVKKIEEKQTESVADHKPPEVIPLKSDPAPELPLIKQRAIVKPHILTHVIEGFVIQEGPEPFPVQRSSLLTEFIPPKPGQPVEQSSLIAMEDEEGEEDESTTPDEQGTEAGNKSYRCEYCNSVCGDPRSNSTQRFCSKSCAKRYNVGCSKRLQHFPGRPKDKGAGRVLKRKRKGRKSYHGNRLQSSGSMAGGEDMEMGEQSSSVSQDESPSPSTTPDHRLHTPPPELHMETEFQASLTSPTKWNVQDVYEFVKSLPGCSAYAEEFRAQEIDGQALLLLKEDHLMTTMNMKLGPALKICARINAIKEETG